jgi:hypothetical protein
MQLDPAAASLYRGGYPAPSTAAFLGQLAAKYGGIDRLFDRESPPRSPPRFAG